ncbi:MAG: MotA/TolQ/ExbB proton channel family protein [Thermoguttaceae bacterium]
MKSSANSIFKKIIASPILWGGAITYLFYSLLSNGIIKSPLLNRYFAAHPIEYVETAMFFVGVTALVIKYFQVLKHRNGILAAPILPEIKEHRVDVRSCDTYLQMVNKFISKMGATYYPKRLHRALKYVRQCESAEQLDQELRYLSDEDAANADSDYGFVQSIIWAIPILGFLGTVVGIAVSMGNLVPEELEKSLPFVMDGLTVAFDTTAIALGFSIVLYFAKYTTSRLENQTLFAIDRQVDEELRGRFELIGAAAENKELIFVRKMLESMIGSFEEMTKNQIATWEKAINTANERFARISSESASQLKVLLAGALRDNIESHAKSLADSEQQLLAKTEKSILAINESIRGNLQTVGSLQENVIRQTDVLRNVIEATGQITRLEDRLNQNLAALGGSRNFEETVNSLAAVIHLLNSKFTGIAGPTGPTGPGEPSLVQLQRAKGKGQAA